MSATPGAKSEYSRGSGGSGGHFRGSEPPFGRRVDQVDRGSGGLILAGSLLAALLLVVAEFTALYQIHVATNSVPIKSVSGGSNHSYAMLVIGLAAAALGISVWRTGSRPALLALGVLGVVALVIALVGDLPDSHASGLAGSASHGYVNASSTPSAGLYLETLGAILLILTCGLGFMLAGSSRPGQGGAGPGSGPGRRAGRPSGRGAGPGQGPRPGSGPSDAPPEGGAGNGHGRPTGNGEPPPAWSRRRRSD
jgi:hypothetical protein